MKSVELDSMCIVHIFVARSLPLFESHKQNYSFFLAADVDKSCLLTGAFPRSSAY